MPEPIIECVPNFSEGRNAQTVEAIASAIRGADGVAVIDVTLDPDHNRSVITFAGPPEAVSEGAFRAVAQAAAGIDMTKQGGVHPRIGAADVVPFVPVRDASLQECRHLAGLTGSRIWRELGIPVYLYEAAARKPERVRLENIRRGGFEELRDMIRTDPSRLPDFGRTELHPTAGATVVGARKFLIAMNINLATGDAELARRIARKIRTSSGGLPCVKALGLLLESRKMAQVSMNLTDFERTPVSTVFRAVREEAEREGVGIAETELIGMIPRGALEGSEEWLPTVRGFHAGLILENRLGI